MSSILLPYFATTKQMLANGLFDDYTRVVALGNCADGEVTGHLLDEFGRSPKFRLGAEPIDRALPLNFT